MRLRLVRVLSAVLLTAAVVPCQVSRNVDLLATWRSPTNPSTAGYNDVWGYHDPVTHREIAIVGSTEGLHFVDCTDPRNPVELKSFVTPRSGGGNVWRDIKTFGHHAYEVSEAYGGTRIFGMAAQTPVLKSWWGTGRWNNAHNIGMDRDTGIAYVSGTNRGVVMFDCTSDPANPTYLGRYASPYIHDLAVRDGYAYFSDQNGNNMLILDASNPPSLPELGRVGLAGASISHNCWPSRDGTIAVATNEAARGPVTIIDISNKQLPAQIATYKVPGVQTSPHNAYLRDRVAHMSYYSEGYRAVDLSDPTNPVEVGYYDTYPIDIPGFGFAGAWGCYHEQPSGVVYVNDITFGLHILKPKALAVRYGTGTPGSAGVPQVYPFGAAYKGNSNFAIELEDARPSVSAVFLLAPNRQTVDLQGLELNVDLSPGLLTVPVSTDANGKARFALPISTTITPGTWFVQALVQDPTSSSPLGVSSSQGVEFSIFSL